MLFFDDSREKWFTEQMKSLLIYQHNTGREIRNQGTLSEMLVKFQMDSDQAVFKDLHGLNEQRFADCRFYRLTKNEYEPANVRNPTKLQLKIDKKQRRLVETLRKFVSVYKFYNKTMTLFGLNNVDGKNVELDIEFIDGLRDYLALQKYLMAISDSKDKGFQITLYRQLHIVLQAALLPDNEGPPMHNHLIM